MSYAIRITETAKEDLRSIYRYIAHGLLEPQAAANQYGRIKSAIITLAEMPKRHPLYRAEPWHRRGLRQIKVDNYLVFYLVNDKDKTVIVIRVMYAARDVGRQLKETIV